jgi:hypothetical protein
MNQAGGSAYLPPAGQSSLFAMLRLNGGTAFGFGSRLDAYEIVRPLGSGGTASVAHKPSGPRM